VLRRRPERQIIAARHLRGRADRRRPWRSPRIARLSARPSLAPALHKTQRSRARAVGRETLADHEDHRHRIALVILARRTGSDLRRHERARAGAQRRRDRHRPRGGDRGCGEPESAISTLVTVEVERELRGHVARARDAASAGWPGGRSWLLDPSCVHREEEELPLPVAKRAPPGDPEATTAHLATRLTQRHERGRRGREAHAPPRRSPAC